MAINGILYYWISRSILRPLKLLSDGTREIRNGNLDVKMKYSRNDEFGDVCQNFEDMRKYLKDSVKQRLEDEKRRKELITGISHDLRTPLTTINGYLDGLIDGIADTPEKQYKYLAAMKTRTGNMVNLVESLSEYSRLDKDFKYHMEDVDLSEYVKKYLETHRTDLQELNIEILFQNPGKQYPVMLDQREFKRIFDNLITNTAKYRIKEKSQVLISVKNTLDEQWIELTFQDDGPGVPQESLTNLFDSFYRVDISRNRAEKGSGIGLAVVREIVIGHGGNVYAQNRSGLAIIIHLPAREEILIVEDDELIAELERDYLEINDFECEIAARGTTGLEKALAENFDLIIIDIMLPGMDGFEVITELRKKKQTPVIFLSAKNTDIDKIRGLGLGADDYMTKPFSPNELVARVKAHISRYDTLTSKSGDVITVGKLMIDKDAHKVTVDGKEISLTAKEYDLLLFLAENPNHTFSKEVLFDRIWGMDAIGDVSTVTVHIQRVRDKINTENERYIETIWGVGYRFNI